MLGVAEWKLRWMEDGLESCCDQMIGEKKVFDVYVDVGVAVGVAVVVVVS